MSNDNRPKVNVAQIVHQHDEERHLMDYVRVVYKRRWVAIPVLLAVFTIGVINSYRTTPLYRASTQLLIEKDSPKVGDLSTIFQQQDGWYNDDFYQTQYKILQSRTLARRTAATMKLDQHPAVREGVREVRTPWTVGGAVRGAWGLATSLVGGGSNGPGEPARAAQKDPDPYMQYAGMVLGSLGITPVRNSRLVDISMTATNPQLAADLANAHARAYIEQNLEYRFSASKDATDWLEAQLAEQRKKVEASESDLQRYKEQHDAVAVEDRQNIVVQRLSDLNGAATKAKTTRIEKEALYNQLRSIQNNNALDSFPAVLANEYIQRLKGDLGDLQRQQAQLADKYGDRHPEMVKVRSAIQSAEAKLQIEIDKIVLSVKSEFDTAAAQERTLVGALEGGKSEALSLNRKGIEFSVLKRETESNRQVYEALLQRTKETGISGELKASNIRVVDSAEVPGGPFLPRRERDLTMAALSGAVLALGLVFLFEYLDNRIKSPQELRAQLNVPFLGMVPSVDVSSGTLLHDGVPPNFAEAIRGVRTNVLFSSADEGVRVVVVTSAGPGEGKSLFSSNLSVSLAQAGQRVLHVDADMRRPRVHAIFDMAQEPGLSNLLVGDCKPSEAIRKTSVLNLCVLPAGMIPPNPAELLGSKRCEEFFATLAQNFDWVILDSPPVLAVADASILANTATGVVFVVGADQTSRQAARAALEQLQAVQAHVIGAVLNRVDLEKNPYYYSAYYRKEYSRYYQQAPRPSQPASRPGQPVSPPSRG
jgi:succinoglycan biosynthesis transport protein ExoP